MLFLIEYDRRKGEVVSLKSFQSGNRAQALEERLQLELSLHQQGIEREIVLLEATNEAAIRKTHRRYFESLDELTHLPDSNKP
jgi:hypothetical protein